MRRHPQDNCRFQKLHIQSPFRLFEACNSRLPARQAAAGSAGQRSAPNLMFRGQIIKPRRSRRTDAVKEPDSSLRQGAAEQHRHTAGSSRSRAICRARRPDSRARAKVCRDLRRRWSASAAAAASSARRSTASPGVRLGSRIADSLADRLDRFRNAAQAFAPRRRAPRQRRAAASARGRTRAARRAPSRCPNPPRSR